MLFLLFLCLYHCDERRNCIYEHLWIYVDILSVLNRIKSGVSEVKTVPSRFMRKIVCRLRLSEVNRQ